MIVIEDEEEHAGVTAVGPFGAEPVEWDDLPNLSDLGRDDPRESPRSAGTNLHDIAFEVLFEDDVAVANAPFEIDLPDGRVVAGRLDARGWTQVLGIPAGACRLRLTDVDAREWEATSVGARPVPPVPSFEGVVEPEPTDHEEDELDPNAPEFDEHREEDTEDTIGDDDVVTRAAVLTIPGWEYDARIFLPVDLSAQPPTEPIDRIARIRSFCALRPDKRIVVLGHSDAAGASSFNEALSAIRAKSVYYYLRGEREQWAGLAAEQASIRDLQLVLAWLAAFCGVPCHPGRIDGESGPCTEAGLAAFRLLAGIGSQASTGDCAGTTSDWGAVFDAYDEWQRGASGYTPGAPLPPLPVDSWMACGERLPASDGRHRRVELMCFDEFEMPFDGMDPVAFPDEYEISEIPEALELESIPYVGVVRKVAEKAIVVLNRTPFALISTHIWARHVRQLAQFAGKSWFLRGTNVKKLVEKTLRNADRVTDEGARMVFEKEFAKAIGTRGETVLRVVVIKATGRIRSSFATLTFKTLTHPLAGVLAITTAANIQTRFSAYLGEQERLEEAREGWFEFVADVAIGGSATVARDEDYIVFERIVEEELAIGRGAFEESVKRENDEFRTMTDDEAEEFNASVVQEIGALDAWGDEEGEVESS
ncbi:MAG: hypothetical protein IAG13_19110 [Deltaproteobacteria bacterium]|nr:hypothetical protein [Nannocystaceae bacterium]